MVSLFRRWKPDADKAKPAKDERSPLSAAAEAIEAARAMGEAAAERAPAAEVLDPWSVSREAELAGADVVDAADAVEAAASQSASLSAVEPAEAAEAPAVAEVAQVSGDQRTRAAPEATAPSVPSVPSAPSAPSVSSVPPAPSIPLESPSASPVALTQEKPAAAPGRSGWRERLMGSGIARGLGGLFSRNPRLDDDLLDAIETALLTADVGISATTRLVDSLRKRMKAREFADANALRSALRADLVGLLEPVARPLVIDPAAKPFVILTVGVNGVGKTTTIGKLAKRFKDEGRGLMLAAGDTFRAAAVAQLQAWGERNGVQVVAQGQDADPAAVAFDALQAARARGTDVLIADTAGRLHTQQGLMAELSKIKRVLAKVDAAAPHEVLLVIDGTTGQNALSQLRHFHQAAGVTGLVVTKLDGTAKGGVVFALAQEFGIPIRFAGIGERPEDLRVFDAEAFVDALLPEALGA
ncbi:signal recognition particle-docking protein FtsY [Luteimonas sp. MC1895]|uniref:signal recognition particle-docking protein FtsY n=1 Tax=Luteimonas sp. MC1895 TaxID=2819513 RepID=UPI0018F0BB99|nr:signal recognition particle-docking protein FtsY [Luteimonas sp. MC1895]MBJ6978047.1 signal recognition particle-docking protein FtsY [Luteimonas sp. MC1895]